MSKVAVVGLAGYAGKLIEIIRQLEAQEKELTLWGVVARYPEENPKLVEELKDRGVRVFREVDALLDAGQGVLDLVTVATSIPSHAPLSIKAMRAGFHVLCEKPPAATIQEVDEMIRVSRETDRVCAIGFQDMYAPSVQWLKRILLSGELGDIKELAARGSWPRTGAYYRRNDWAGKIKVNDAFVLDGPMNNALSHFLQMMLYLAGGSGDEPAVPETVQAELYRARADIQGDDTGCLRLRTSSRIDVHFAVTHSAREPLEPVVEICTTDARVHWYRSGRTVIDYKSGDKREFEGKQNGSSPHFEMLRNVAKAIRGEIGFPISHVERTRSFVLAVNGAHESSKGVHQIPPSHVDIVLQDTSTNDQVAVRDINQIILQAFAQRRLFSEMGVPWAVSTEPFSLVGYSRFPFQASL